jgi:membrane protein required for colicin V production
MNWLDVTILVICAAGLIEGLVKGFVRQAFSLIGLVLAVILAFRYYPLVGQYLEQWIHQQTVLTIASFVIILAVVLLLFKLIGLAARAAIAAIHLGWFDRVVGALFGFAKSVVLVAVLFALFIVCTDRPTKPVASSRLAPTVMAISGVISRFFPEQVREHYDENEARLMARLKGKTPVEQEKPSTPPPQST